MQDAGRREYRYVVFSRTQVYDAAVAGSTIRIGAATAAEAVARHPDARSALADAQDMNFSTAADWDQGLSDFVADTSVEPFQALRDGAAQDFSRITYPNGDVEEVVALADRSQIRATFVRLAGPRPGASDTPVRPEKPKAVARLGWVCMTIDAEGRKEHVGIDLPEAWGAPLVDIAQILTQLSAKGWSIESVSEDKALSGGEEEVVPTRIRLLLSRPAPG